jgi:hypothetical protein
MTDKIDTILAAARRHCQTVIRPEVNAWNTAQHYPRPGQRRAVFDLVLVPAR